MQFNFCDKKYFDLFVYLQRRVERCFAKTPFNKFCISVILFKINHNVSLQRHFREFCASVSRRVHFCSCMTTALCTKQCPCRNDLLSLVWKNLTGLHKTSPHRTHILKAHSSLEYHGVVALIFFITKKQKQSNL